MISMDPTGGCVAAWVQISLGNDVRGVKVSVGYDMSQFQSGLWDAARAG